MPSLIRFNERDANNARNVAFNCSLVRVRVFTHVSIIVSFFFLCESPLLFQTRAISERDFHTRVELIIVIGVSFFSLRILQSEKGFAKGKLLLSIFRRLVFYFASDESLFFSMCTYEDVVLINGY